MYEYDNNNDSVLSVEELMDILKIGKNVAYRLLNAGTIPAFRIGKCWKIPQSSLDDFIINSAKNSYRYLYE